MNISRRRFSASILGATGLLLGGHRTAFAQGKYPDRPIKLIVPFAAGSSTDIAARNWAEVFSKMMPGSTMIVENRAGAGGTIGAAAVAKSPADGYNLLYSTATTYAIAPFIYPNLQYNPVQDFVPVVVTTSVPTVLVTAADSGILSYQDLREKVNAAPDRFNYGSNGVGTHSHITCKLIANRMGVPDLLHVPFKNGSQGVMTEVMAGRLSFAVDAWSVVGPLIRSGRLRALGANNKTRLSVAPDLPTLAEQMNQDFDTLTWSGIWAPTGTSDEIISLIHAKITEGRKDPELVKWYEEQGTPLMPDMTLPQVNDFMKSEIERWRAMVKEANITI